MKGASESESQEESVTQLGHAVKSGLLDVVDDLVDLSVVPGRHI